MLCLHSLVEIFEACIKFLAQKLVSSLHIYIELVSLISNGLFNTLNFIFNVLEGLVIQFIGTDYVLEGCNYTNWNVVPFFWPQD